uniref:Pentatricopeptide repeat-containing protein n=1 Tax=Tanacetum cinerariifolium TaxID=118510 RepID=A0A699JZJ9_TANCI|nr:pentatricopeptide repeat-containing protein [Tanacetum cinerariifolium]
MLYYCKLNFQLGEKFPTVDKFKECLTYYALANGFSLYFKKGNKEKIVAKCGQKKEVIKDPSQGKQKAFKKYPFNNSQNTRCRWRCNLKKKYKCIVSKTQCKNAKNFALNEGKVTIQDHYGFLRSYAKALDDSNEGSTVKVVEGLLLLMVVLKKTNCGEILIAVGSNGNNHIFPIAWAVVSVENKDNWTWFLKLIAKDLDVPNGAGLTLMSNQHKGLIEAVKDVMPLVEHRQCARHIYDGFRKQFSGVQFRELFWAASKATYPQRFNKVIEKIKTANPKAHKYLLDKIPKIWFRAFFTKGRCCEAVENGLSECFNSVLVSVRHQPAITMLESIQVIIMERMNTIRHLMEKGSNDVGPNIQKILEHSRIYKDTIEETEPYQASMPIIKNPSNFIETQQSQVSGVGGLENYSLPPRKQILWVHCKEQELQLSWVESKQQLQHL